MKKLLNKTSIFVTLNIMTLTRRRSYVFLPQFELDLFTEHIRFRYAIRESTLYVIYRCPQFIGFHDEYIFKAYALLKTAL